MNSIKKLFFNRFSLFGLYIFLGLIDIVDARAGGAGRSSHSSSSYSSGSSDGGAGLYFLFRFLFFTKNTSILIVVIKLFIIVIIINIAYNYLKNSKNEKNGQINRYTDYTLSKNSLRENKIVIGEEDFKLRNPNFIKDTFLQKVTLAFTEIQNAWVNKDLKNVRRYISDSVYQRFNVQFQMMNKLEQIDKINNLKIISTIIDKYEKDGEYDVYEYKPFNIGSPAQRVTKLLSLGWKPQKFTDKGNPQVDEESLLDFYNKSDRPEIKAIAEWLVFTGRANMVQTWLNNVGPDSRIHGKVFTCKAGTRRMTHSSPNTANIPKASAKVPYGKECRQLWSVADKDRRRLVGYDAKGLEMRMFAHYLNNPVAAELYVSGDPHQVNADLLGIERDPVKNVFYAFLYGAADPKLGWTGNTSLVSKKEQREFGKFIRGELVAKTPGLTELVKLVQAEGTWIQCIDGGYVRCEAEHARINYKLQSAGAIVMKQASIFADRYIKQRGLDALLVGSIHDEGQLDTALKDTEEVGKLCVQAIIDAGEELNFRVPLDGDYKIGFSWAETH